MKSIKLTILAVTTSLSLLGAGKVLPSSTEAEAKNKELVEIKAKMVITTFDSSNKKQRKEVSKKVYSSPIVSTLIDEEAIVKSVLSGNDSAQHKDKNTREGNKLKVTPSFNSNGEIVITGEYEEEEFLSLSKERRSSCKLTDIKKFYFTVTIDKGKNIQTSTIDLTNKLYELSFEVKKMKL